MLPLGVLLFLLSLLHSGFSSDCQPGFADTCFSGVSHDLQYMLNLKEMVAKNVTTEAVHELCMAIEDSLNCTEDVIDGDCSKTAGRVRFDSWLKALRGAHSYVCQGKEHKPLKMLLQSTPCWSLEDFILCSEQHLKLTHVRDLLHTEINAVECRELHDELRLCTKLAIVGSCREEDDIYAEIHKMVSAFFSTSPCHPTTYRAYAANAVSPFLSFSTLLVLCLWFLCMHAMWLL